MGSNHQTPFGTRLRQFREAASISQLELAERAGLSLRGISDLERGARLAPRLETVRMIADGLQLNNAQRAELLAARKQSDEFGHGPNTFDVQSLPSVPTSFFGRASEIETILSLLARNDVRLVTLTGPGGVGKTRVALEAARKAADRFPRGLVFVDLAPERDPAMVLAAIAARLGVVDYAHADLRVVLPLALAGQRLLVVLDNMEQVVESATDLAWLLAACPDLTILATSRIVLRIAAENVLVIEPFATVETEDLDRLRNDDAVQMFVARARAANARFELSADNASDVADVVARLLGIPLAIELAASHIRLWPVAELAARLDAQLPVLTGGMRDAPARHRTMADTIAWSYDLLSVSDQAVLRALSIFPVGCTLDTAIAVVGHSGSSSETEIIEAVEKLVDSNLIRARDGSDGRIRYRMLLPVREFSLERLASSGDEQRVRRAAHVAWCVPLAGRAEFIDFRPSPLSDIALLEAEMQNLKEHVAWLMEQDQVTEALEIEGSLAFYRWQRGYLGESRPHLERLLADPRNQTATPGRARSLIGLGLICYSADDVASSLVALSKGADTARQVSELHLQHLALLFTGYVRAMLVQPQEAEQLLDEAHEIGVSINIENLLPFELLGRRFIAEVRGEFGLAFQLLEEALRSAKHFDMTWFGAMARLAVSGYLTDRGDMDEAEVLVREAQHLLEALGDARGMLEVYNQYHFIASRRNDEIQAREFAHRIFQYSQEIGSLGGIAAGYFGQAEIALDSKDFDSAFTLAETAISMEERCGRGPVVVTSFDFLADIFIAAGEAARAAWCIGAVDEVRHAHGIGRSSTCVAKNTTRIEKSKLLLAEDEWQAHYDRGRSLSVDEMLAEVHSWGSREVSVPGT